MPQWGDLVAVLTNATWNAVIGWILLGLLGLIGVESLLDADWVWFVFVLFIVVVGVIPPIAFKDARIMLPWEVLLLVMFPLLGRGLLGSGLGREIATYAAVAGLALIVAVELDVFTAVKMTTWFAIFFVVVATMAAIGAWAVVQWVSDVYLGTTFIYPVPPPVSQAVEQAALETLMWEFVAATATGIGAGIVFALYFRRAPSIQYRIPAWVRRRIG
ncbi:MAG: hypothetical protein ABEJ58_09055 [Halodesulfurarchaeum sp.]